MYNGNCLNQHKRIASSQNDTEEKKLLNPAKLNTGTQILRKRNAQHSQFKHGTQSYHTGPSQKFRKEEAAS